MRALLALLMLCAATLARAAEPSVYLEDLSWTELRDALAAGRTTAIVPVGGTEQNGPHMALGKHNLRVHLLAGRIATTLGDALVAPVIAHVPEGRIVPPAGHMRYPGTISVSDAAFQGLLDGTVRSLRQAGFRHIVLIGDHGGYQSQLATVAQRLDADAALRPARVHYLAAYYRAQAEHAARLRAQGLSDVQIGTHAGSADTSLSLALAPSLVRPEKMPPDARTGSSLGVAGDPRASSAALGQIGVDLIVDRSVAAIRDARRTVH